MAGVVVVVSCFGFCVSVCEESSVMEQKDGKYIVVGGFKFHWYIVVSMVQLSIEVNSCHILK